jgi:folylpolyglutamate synthase/dihydropteroate synthase
MTTPKWLTEQSSKRSLSDKKVSNIAKKTGGKVVANSGATLFSKGDIRYENALAEHKYTDKKSYKLNACDLQKIYQDATKVRKDPVFIIDFGSFMLVGQVFKKLS